MRSIAKFMLGLCITAAGFCLYAQKYHKQWLPPWMHKKAVAFKTEQPLRRTIVSKKVFFGHLKPHKEVNIESHITGILERLFVQEGDYVQQGAAIARIKIQPSMQSIEEAENRLRSAAIIRNKVRPKFVRAQQLFRKKMIAKEEYEGNLAEWENAKESFFHAEKAVQIAQLGYTKEKGRVTNLVKATVKGTVLALPVKEGSMVQAKSGQSQGTEVVVIGDMNRFLFTALVSELDVVFLKEGMTFEVTLNACNKEKLKVTLTKIAPKADKASSKNGQVKFAIEGVVKKPKNLSVTLRDGYIAFADIVVNKANNVLSVQEKMIQMEKGNYFVKCLQDDKVVDKQVLLGLSDGLYVEVQKGLTEADQLIVEA